MPAELSVIVVSWNTRDLTLSCLNSLVESLGSGVPARAEILVVDNASTDGSADAIAARHPDVTLLRNPDNVGFARGVNLGLARAVGEYVVLLNSDAIVEPGAVQHLVGYLRNHPDTGIVGGRQVGADGEFVPTGHRFPSIRHDLATVPGAYQVGRFLLRRVTPVARLVFVTDTRDVDWLSGAFVAFRRQVVDDIGGLPDEFFVYGEDVEWCWRARRHGWRVVYVDGPGIVHHGGGSADRLPGDDARSRLVLDALHTFARHHRNPLAWRAGWVARSAFLGARALRRWAAGRAAEARPMARLAGRHLEQVVRAR